MAMRSTWEELVTESQLEEVLSMPREHRMEKLEQFSRISERQVLMIMSSQYELEVLEEVQMVDKPTELLPLRILLEYQCVILKEHEDCLEIATSWPPDNDVDKWIFASSGKRVLWRLTRSQNVQQSLTKAFGVGSGSLDEEDIESLMDEPEEIEEENEDAAVIRFVNEVVQEAVGDGATDIHFEPQEESIQVRYRIDGELVPISLPENLVHFQNAIVSRIKIMAKLNISEKRRPQDGRITFRANNHDFDIRISTFPTMYGESISLRLLNQKAQPMSTRQLGMLPDDEMKASSILSNPHGIILVTGPTGSGKSTSENTISLQWLWMAIKEGSA